MQFGRKQIFTDEMQITKDNVIKVLQDALIVHEQNRTAIKFLLDYERGIQPIDDRIKEIRPEINIKVKDNMAAEITEFKLGYEWGSPIRYVQRANKGIRENNKDADNVGIAMLNEMMEEENKPSADQELARFIEICGVGYRLIKAKPDQYRFGSSVVDILTLNPMNTFVVYSNDVYRRPIMGVSYITDQSGNSTYGCYTEDTYYEVENIIKMTKEKKRAKWFVSNGNGRKNIPAAIPIVEYINDYDRMGCFERVISEIDALNVVTSDRVNDIVQCVQSLLWVHNANLPKDENGNSTVRNGALIETKSTGNGHDPKMAYLSKEMSQDGIQTLIQNFIDRIHEKTNVPGRQEQGGGSTGSAMNLSNGWQAAELSALKKSQLTKKSEKECIRIMLEIFNNDVDVPEEVRNLKLADIEPKFDRNRTYDLATKVNSWATLIQNGADLLKATELAGFTTDAQQFVLDSEEMVNKLLESKLKGSEPVDTASEGKVNDSDEQTTMDGKNMPDMSDQPQATPFANA